MLNFELQNKIEDCLKQGGFMYDFSIDTNHFFDYSYGKYTSLTLKSITGILNNSISNNNNQQPSYDIDLINEITQCLIRSKDDELISVAWNSFLECAYDKKFVLYDEIKKAREFYVKNIETSFATNHTKSLESERLFIRSNNEEYGRDINEYIQKFDKDEYLFARMARNCSSQDYFLFSLCLKKTNEVVGDIGLAFDVNSDNTFHLSYYIKKEHRRNGYIKEAFNVILDAIKSNEIILYGQWNREYVLEETKPVIEFLRIELDENNIASFNTAKALGFDYEGKILNPKKINNETKYNYEYHFVMKIDANK